MAAGMVVVSGGGGDGGGGWWWWQPALTMPTSSESYTDTCLAVAVNGAALTLPYPPHTHTHTYTTSHHTIPADTASRRLCPFCCSAPRATPREWSRSSFPTRPRTTGTSRHGPSSAASASRSRRRWRRSKPRSTALSVRNGPSCGVCVCVCGVCGSCVWCGVCVCVVWCVCMCVVCVCGVVPKRPFPFLWCVCVRARACGRCVWCVVWCGCVWCGRVTRGRAGGVERSFSYTPRPALDSYLQTLSLTSAPRGSRMRATSPTAAGQGQGQGR